MNIKDSYLHGADGKGVVKWLYLASSAETVYKPSDGTTYTTASGKDLIFQLADISGTKFGITLPQAPAYSQGVQTRSRSTNASHYLVFVDSNNSSATNELLYTDAEIVYNPSTNLLSVPKLTVSGAGGFNYSGIAAATENAATCIWFSDSTNAGIPVTSNNFKYNPSTDTLTVGNIAGQYIKIGNKQVALKGTYTPDTSITSSSTHNTIPSSKAVWDLITNIDAFVYKGILNGGSSTTYTPAANCGHVYKVATAGLINGVYCEVGDLFICNADSTAAATSSNVGTISTKWDIIQANATMADYLLRAGGTMLGNLKWNDTNALPEDTTPSYLITVSGVPASGSAAITKYTSVAGFKQNIVSNFVVGTQTAATNLWTGALPAGITSYYNGLSIDYYLPFAGTSTAATLNLGGLGAIQVYNGRGQGNTTTHFPAKSIIRMTYYNSKWYVSSYYDSNTVNTTGGDNTSSKIFLVGMTAQTSSNGYSRTYTHDTCYIGTDGCLYSGGAKVLTALPSSAVTGSGTNGYITRWTGEHTIGNLVALSAAVSSQTQSTKFLREDGTWAAPSYTTNTNTWRNVRINAETSDKLGTGTNTGPLIIKSGTGITVLWDSTNKAVVITNSAPDVNHNTDRTGLKKGTAGSTTASGLVIANSAAGLIMEGGNHKFKVGDGTNSFEIPITVTNLSQSSITSLSTFTHTSDLIYAAAGGSNSVADKPSGVGAFGVISMKTADGWYGQLLMSSNTASGVYWRTASSTLSGGWKLIADSSNVVNNNISVTWNTETTIATIAGVPIKIKIPANPNSNTWRNIYTGGTSRVGTGTNTKAMNFVATGNLSVSYLAAGTSSGQSGSADYFTVRINAAAWTGATDSTNGTAGYMPAATSANRLKFLRGDGSWVSLSASDHTHKVKINGTEKTIAAPGGAAVDLGNYVPKIAGTGSVVAHQTSVKDWKGCKILIPGGYNAWMIAFTVRIYVNYQYTDIVFSGYHYGSQHWNTPKARVIGGTINYKVVMGYEGDSANSLYVWIGNTNDSVLGYGGITVMNLHAGHNNNPDWYTTWTISNVAYANLTNKQYDTTTILPAMSDHTHSLSIAADSGTNQLTLAASTKYKLTAGGSTYVFTTPPNTWTANAVGVAGYVAAPTAANNKYNVWMTDGDGKPAWRAVTVPATVPTIGTSDTTLATIGGITVKAKIGSYASSSHTHYYLVTSGDHRNVVTTPNDYSNKFTFVGLKSNSALGITGAGTYSYLIGLRGWSDHSGGGSHELAFSESLGLFRRIGTSATEWGSWIRIADSSNISNKAATIGPTLTTIATIAGVNITAKIDITKSASQLVSVEKTLTVSTWEDVAAINTLAAGTYAIQINSGVLYASGIFTACGATDAVTDEIPLHVSSTSATTWRPYARVHSNYLQMATNETTGTARTYTIKIIKLI